jgi:hypothetical protein
VVVEDERELIRARAEGQQGGVIEPWATMHHHHWVTVANGLHEEGNVSE